MGVYEVVEVMAAREAELLHSLIRMYETRSVPIVIECECHEALGGEVTKP